MCALHVLHGEEVVDGVLEPLDPPGSLAAGGPEVVHHGVRVRAVSLTNAPHGLQLGDRQTNVSNKEINVLLVKPCLNWFKNVLCKLL